MSRATVATAATALAVALAGHPAPAGPRAIVPVPTPAARWVDPRRPAAPPFASLLSSIRRGAGLEEIVGAQARTLTAPRARGGSDMIPSDPAVDPFYMAPRFAGDLNGDGTDDVLVVEFPLGSTEVPDGAFRYPPSRLVARSGTDGAVLWSRPTSDYPYDFYLYFPVEGTAQGLAGSSRPLVVTLDLSSPGEVRSGVVTQTLSILDGANGSVAWSREFPAVFAGDSAVLFTEATIGMITSVVAAPDYDGDATPEVLVSLLSGSHVTGVLLGGATGEVIGSAQAVYAWSGPGWAWVVPGHAPDGSPSLVTLSVVAGRAVLSDVPAAGGAPYWSAPLATAPLVDPVFVGPADVYVLPPVDARLAGRGAYLVERLTVFGDVLLLDAVNGEDGSMLWSRQSNGYPDAAGDADGDGVTDVRIVRAGSSGIEMETLSGWSGEDLWDEEIDPPVAGARAGISVCACGADITGDAANESILAATAYDAHGVAIDRRGIAIDGRDGSVLWITPPLAGAYEYPFAAGVDLTGDGSPDVVGFVLESGPPDQVRLGLRAHNGRDFAPAWTQTVLKPARTGDWYVRAELVPIHTPSGRGAIALALNEYSPERNPDGTKTYHYYPSVHLLSDEGVLWNA